MAYRAFPPFVLGSPVVEISISSGGEMVVVTSDGNFYVYALTSTCGKPKLNYKGSIIPAMQHMYLSSSYAPSANQRAHPKMTRIQITDSNQLMLILVMQSKSSTGGGGQRSTLLQGFIYNCDMELWMRISDSNNFVLSDFYSSLSPGMIQQGEEGGSNNGTGILAKMDRFVKSNSASSSMASAKQMYQKVAASSSEGNANNATTSQKIITRSHCEDRLACSIALASAGEFQIWIRYYARCLVSTGDGDALRFVVDILLGGDSQDDAATAMLDSGKGVSSSQPKNNNVPSFLSAGRQTLGLEGKTLIRKAILPEMSKNRLLQRLTNEISMELECL